jgi:hypothetical protein
MSPNHPTHKGQTTRKGSRGPYEHDRGAQATIIYVPRASLAGFPKGAKVRSLLRSVAALDGCLEENERRSEDEVRLRRIKRWRGEALEQLRGELGLARP